MNYTEDTLKQITQAGTVGYPASRIANILDIQDVKQFYLDFDDRESVVSKAYQKGLDKADFLLDVMLFNKAKEGDLRALQKYEDRKAEQLERAKAESKKRNK